MDREGERRGWMLWNDPRRAAWAVVAEVSLRPGHVPGAAVEEHGGQQTANREEIRKNRRKRKRE